MKYWVTCPADVENLVSDKRERPDNYEEHFYPCYIMYEEPWDSLYGNFYFMNKSRKEAINMRHTNLMNYIAEKRRQIEAAELELKKLKKF